MPLHHGTALNNTVNGRNWKATPYILLYFMFLDDQFKELIVHVFDQPDELICDSTSYLMFDLTSTILNKEF
jgi:hypothetical protein